LPLDEIDHDPMTAIFSSIWSRGRTKTASFRVGWPAVKAYVRAQARGGNHASAQEYPGRVGGDCCCPRNGHCPCATRCQCPPPALCGHRRAPTIEGEAASLLAAIAAEPDITLAALSARLLTEGGVPSRRTNAPTTSETQAMRQS